MAPETLALINAKLAAPKTHAVITTFSDGRTRRFETQSLKQAENYSIMDKRNIGRSLIDRATGQASILQSVEIIEI